MPIHKGYIKSTTILTSTQKTVIEELIEPQHQFFRNSLEHQPLEQSSLGAFWDVSIPFLLDGRVEHIPPGDPLWEQARRRLREHWRTKYPNKKDWMAFATSKTNNKAGLLVELKAYADELG